MEPAATRRRDFKVDPDPYQEDYKETDIKIAWDLAGLAFLVLGSLLFLGIFGFTKGIIIDSIVAFFARWLGWGRFLLPLTLILAGWTLLLVQNSGEYGMRLRKVLVIELGTLLMLGAISALKGDMIEEVQAGLSGGGIVGWGLASPVRSLIGPSAAGILYLLLGMLFLILGTNLSQPLENWARRRLGEASYSGQSRQADFRPETQATAAVPVSVEAAPSSRNVKPVSVTAKQESSARQEPLPLNFRDVRKLNPFKESKPSQSQKRSDALPPYELLDQEKSQTENTATINMNAGLLEQTLAEFGVPAKVVGYRVGPTVTQYAVEPGYMDKAGSDEKIKVRINKIANLNKDLALALKAERLRIVAPVPGKSYIGVEVPNAVNTVVRLRPIMESEAFTRINSPLAVPLGRDVSGQPLVSDLASMPHLLIAGATNSGKSICIAAITTCLIMNNHPQDLKLVMIDPKMVELTRFNGLPHLLGQVETDVERIQSVLRWATTEMEHRYKLLEDQRSRNLDSYNAKMERLGRAKLPRIVILIDELADLMMNAPESTEGALVRLAQKARAIGIHLVVATQRPSTDVVTGVIKANFPTRIAFMVASMVDSRVILDSNGAETLLGKGDMLFLHPQVGTPQRSQGVYVSDKEISKVLSWWQENAAEQKEGSPIEESMGGKPAANQSSNGQTLAREEPRKVIIGRAPQQPPVAVQASLLPEAGEEEAPWEAVVAADAESGTDEGLIKQAIEIVRKDRRASATYLQRRLRIGYPKAAWLMDQLEERSVLGPSMGSGREREILLDDTNDELDQA